MEDVVVVIPARVGSKRLPEKPLRELCGKPLISWVVEAVRRVVSDVIVATDSDEVVKVVEEAGAKGVLTPSDLPSGTDRVYYAVRRLSYPFVINVQGDEPFVKEEHIRAVYEGLKRGYSFSTVSTPFKRAEEVKDPSKVKVVLDRDGRALYFSRSPIPFPRDGEIEPENYLKHIGIYGYRREALERFVSWEEGKLERIEKLEQLRILENGEDIFVSVVGSDSFGVDTEEDLKKAEKMVKERFKWLQS